MWGRKSTQTHLSMADNELHYYRQSLTLLQHYLSDVAEIRKSIDVRDAIVFATDGRLQLKKSDERVRPTGKTSKIELDCSNDIKHELIALVHPELLSEVESLDVLSKTAVMIDNNRLSASFEGAGLEMSDYGLIDQLVIGSIEFGLLSQMTDKLILNLGGAEDPEASMREIEAIKATIKQVHQSIFETLSGYKNWVMVDDKDNVITNQNLVLAIKNQDEAVSHIHEMLDNTDQDAYQYVKAHLSSLLMNLTAERQVSMRSAPKIKSLFGMVRPGIEALAFVSALNKVTNNDEMKFIFSILISHAQEDVKQPLMHTLSTRLVGVLGAEFDKQLAAAYFKGSKRDLQSGKRKAIKLIKRMAKEPDKESGLDQIFMPFREAMQSTNKPGS